MLPFLGFFHHRRDGSVMGAMITNIGMFAVMRSSLFGKVALAGLSAKDLASSEFKRLCVSYGREPGNIPPEVMNKVIEVSIIIHFLCALSCFITEFFFFF